VFRFDFINKNQPVQQPKSFMIVASEGFNGNLAENNFNTMIFEHIPLQNNEALHQFELIIDGRKSFINYKQKGIKVYLIHTQVPPELEGQGIAGALVEKTLGYLQRHELKLIPLCSFVVAYLERNPQWKSLLADYL